MIGEPENKRKGQGVVMKEGFDKIFLEQLITSHSNKCRARTREHDDCTTITVSTPIHLQFSH